MAHDWKKDRDKIIGLGEHSLHKSYYPELQEKIDKLELSQRNFSTLINSISDAILIHDKNGCILSLNNQAKETFNIEASDSKQYTFFDISSPKQNSDNLQNLWDDILNNNTQMFEWIGLQQGTNTEIQLQISLSPTTWDNKHVIVAVIRDFTERKEFEQELILEKEKAEEASRLKTEFLHNVSHEVRTPMNGIMGFTELLSDEKLSSEQRTKYIDIVKQSSNQLLNIIDDILEISRLETNQAQVNIETFDLNAVLKEIYSIFEIQSKKSQIDFSLHLGSKKKELLISSDKTKLSSIINNLVGNAFKFTNVGFVKLGYTMKNGRIEIYISDSGIGIAKDKTKSIFGRFEQEEKEISLKAGGLGLGLPISQANAKLLNGDLSVESEKGVGSTFYLKIPFTQIKQKESTNQQIQNNIEEKELKTILIAEDEEVNFLYIEALLSNNSNFEILHAINGQIAIDLFKENMNIDLVLMDLKMPVLNGFEAALKIKAINPKIPIIALTAYSTAEDKKKSLDSGCDEFMSKPFEKEKFYLLLDKYL